MSADRYKFKSLKFVLIGVLLGAAIGVLILQFFDIENVFSSAWRNVWKNETLTVPESNHPAPDFSLANLDGKIEKLEDFRGKKVILNFWATWCIPCKVEMPIFQEIYESSSAELTIFAINSEESIEVVTKFLEENNISIPVLLDFDGQATQDYRVRAFPQTLFIDASGNLRYQHAGVISKVQILNYLQKMDE